MPTLKKLFYTLLIGQLKISHLYVTYISVTTRIVHMSLNSTCGMVLIYFGILNEIIEVYICLRYVPKLYSAILPFITYCFIT